MPVQGPERTPFSDADAAIPAERAGVTYRISEKERIEQRRAARLSVCRPESRRSGDVGGLGNLSTIHPQSHAPERRGDDSKRLTNPPAPVREGNTDPLSLWERARVRVRRSLTSYTMRASNPTRSTKYSPTQRQTFSTRPQTTHNLNNPPHLYSVPSSQVLKGAYKK